MESFIQLHFGKVANLHLGAAYVRHTPVEEEAEQMRHTLRAMLPKEADFMADLRAMRNKDAAVEARDR